MALRAESGPCSWQLTWRIFDPNSNEYGIESLTRIAATSNSAGIVAAQYRYSIACCFQQRVLFAHCSSLWDKFQTSTTGICAHREAFGMTSNDMIDDKLISCALQG
eukprot:4108099-Pleurochrysis_carterae.AAC.1